MANLNLKYYDNDDKYSEGDIENDILEMVRNNIQMDELPPEKVNYSIIYHLSKLRENILNWYPFSKEETVLEVGAGCGAITGLLCRKLKKVTAVELSKRRSDINYTRNKNYDNLNIFVGNLNDMNFEERFDYIVLNGVLEYAISFTAGNNPYEDFLLKLSKFLKKDGRLIIAIENRLGLKYFSGSVEDHTGQYFSGLNQYENHSEVCTFSKSEMQTLLKSIEFGHFEFYYPYPDYKFPIEIFTEDTFMKNEYGKQHLNFDITKRSLFQEQKVTDSFIQEGVMSVFANSFLVVASREKINDKIRVLYSKINNDRIDKFRIITTIEEIDGEKIVIKEALCKEAKAHILTILENSNMETGEKFGYLKGKIVNDKIVFPYLDTSSLTQEVLKFIREKQISKIIDVIREIYDGYLSDAYLSETFINPDFQKVFGKETIDRALPCKKNLNIDLTCDNIYRAGNELIDIDCEWCFKFEIPTQFVIWRTINELYTKYKELELLKPINDMFLEFGIDQKLTYTFWSWAVYFGKEFVKTNHLEKYSKDIKKINLKELIEYEEKDKFIEVNLYYDMGEGYLEKNKISHKIELADGRFSISYDLSHIDGLKKLRFDPIEGACCACMLNQDNYKFIPMNAAITNHNFDVFLTTDPMYEIEISDGPIKLLEIQGELKKLNQEEISKYHQNILIEQQIIYEDQISDLNNQIQSIVDQVEEEKEGEKRKNDKIINKIKRKLNHSQNKPR